MANPWGTAPQLNAAPTPGYYNAPMPTNKNDWLTAYNSNGGWASQPQQPIFSGGMSGYDYAGAQKYQDWLNGPEGQYWKNLTATGRQNNWMQEGNSALTDAIGHGVEYGTSAAVIGGIAYGGGLAASQAMGGGAAAASGNGVASSGLGGGSGSVGSMFGGGATTGGGLSGGVGAAGAGAGTGLGGAVAGGSGYGIGMGGPALEITGGGSGSGLYDVMPGANAAASSTGANPVTGGGGYNGFMDSIFGAGKGAAATSALLPILGQAGLDAWAADRQRSQTNTAAERADPFASQRPQYQQQLAGLQNDPSSFANNPAYKFAFNQGEEALTRNASKVGNLGSGNLGLDLVKYGQDAAYTGLNNEKSFLAGLAGANIGSPGMAGQITNNSPSIAQTYQGLSGLGTIGRSLYNNYNGSQTPYNGGNNAGAII